MGRVVVMMKKKERGHWENIVEVGDFSLIDLSLISH